MYRARLSSKIGVRVLTLCGLLVVSGCAVEDPSESGSIPAGSTNAEPEGPAAAPRAEDQADPTDQAPVPAAPAAGADAVDDSAAVPAEVLGEGEDEPEVPIAQYASFGTKVATVGDSWMHNTLFTGTAISGALKRAGLRLDNYAAQGVTLLPPANLFGTPVSTQIEKSVITRNGTSQYKTVIATGGGNDVILNAPLEQSCSASSATSPQFARCLDKLNEIFAKWQVLWEQLGKAGVADIVYVSYSNQAGSAPVANDYSNAKMTELCAQFDGESTSIRCTFVDGNDYVKSKRDLIFDGIHPKRAINDQIAKGILAAMSARGIAR